MSRSSGGKSLSSGEDNDIALALFKGGWSIAYFPQLLATTGIGPDQIGTAAGDSEFLSGVLDYFLSDEPLLIAFAKSEGIDPFEVQRARAAFGGVWERDLP